MCGIQIYFAILLLWISELGVLRSISSLSESKASTLMSESTLYFSQELSSAVIKVVGRKSLKYWMQYHYSASTSVNFVSPFSSGAISKQKGGKKDL